MAVPISKSSQIFEYGTNSEIKLSTNSQQTNIMKMYMDLFQFGSFYVQQQESRIWYYSFNELQRISYLILVCEEIIHLVF